MEVLKLCPPKEVFLNKKLNPERSKSISNRLLIMQMLSGFQFGISNLSESKDTIELTEALDALDYFRIYAGEGGTTYRFLLPLLSLAEGEYELYASGSMKKRPIGPLVNALRSLGAEINYLKEEGFPPVFIGMGKFESKEVEIDASVSSQFVSALLLIGPYLPQGLQLNLQKEVVSSSYIHLTIALMRKLGAKIEWNSNIILVAPQPYQYQGDINVESDWSGASYLWAHADLLGIKSFTINGLVQESLQGDSILLEFAQKLGYEFEETQKGIRFLKVTDGTLPTSFDFLGCPDLAQTLIPYYVIKQKEAEFTGLQTLVHKETDRLKALQKELKKLGADLNYDTSGTARLSLRQIDASSIVFETYSDHRMAMGLSLFATQYEITIKEPRVVNKSFPNFWKELTKFGYKY